MLDKRTGVEGFGQEGGDEGEAMGEWRAGVAEGGMGGKRIRGGEWMGDGTGLERCAGWQRIRPKEECDGRGSGLRARGLEVTGRG
ncbi:hypothetical protein ACFL5O_11985 [Myxococcota bacterium]